MPDLDVTRSIRAIESIKADLLVHLAGLYKDMSGFGRRADFEESFAQIVSEAYLLAAKLGVSYGGLDERAVSLLRLKLLENPDSKGDAGALISHLSGRKEP
ncbi:MAG: MazG-like family protein [Defluviitaleaceae bacterium]|nr:MazG-like family protein [Defluviitaleaceae bacterium]